MKFSNFSKVIKDNNILFFNTYPIENVSNIKYYDVKNEIVLKGKFRWSFNKEYWSAWEPLTQTNIANIDIDGNYYLFLEISFTNNIDIDAFTLVYDENIAPIRVEESDRILIEDIKQKDTSAVIIHDIIQTHKITQIKNAELLDEKIPEYYLQRINHTGTQPISSVLGLQSIIDDLYSMNYVSDASLNPLYFIWNGGYLDISISELDDVIEFKNNTIDIGWTGTFKDFDGSTITVQNGLIINKE